MESFAKRTLIRSQRWRAGVSRRLDGLSGCQPSTRQLYRTTQHLYTKKCHTVSSIGRLGADDERQGEPLLVLILAALVAVAGVADGLAAEEEDLRDAFAGVNLRGQRRGIGDLNGHFAAPFRLQGRYIANYAATRVRRFSNA